jgi:hypothetical protein
MNIFQGEYKTAINNILKDIYEDTEYWGEGEKGNLGIIKPITKDDDPNWSNYNFINTHYIVRDDIVEPFVRQKGFKEDIELNRSYKDSDINREYFRILWLNRHELFGPESSLTSEIVKTVNKTRKPGQKRENTVFTVLNKLPFLDIEMRGAAGSSEDFSGTDAIITYRGSDYTTQIKNFYSYQKLEKGFFVNLKMIRKYKQDLYLFSRQSGDEYHILIFKNRTNRITENGIFFPSSDFFLAVNYKMKDNKISYKLND